MVFILFVPNTAADTQAYYSIGSAKWCLVAAETGPIHTPFRKAFKHTHTSFPEKGEKGMVCFFWLREESEKRKGSN